MNLDALGNIGDFLGGVGVVVTLIYLAIQTNQLAAQTELNTTAMISGSRQQALDAELQILRMIVDYLITGLGYPAASDEDDVRRQQAVDLAFFRVREQQWLQFRDGHLDEATWESYLALLIFNIQTNDRIGQRWNAFAAAGFAPGFVSTVNAALGQ